MAIVYTQIYIHCIFAVKGHENSINPSFRDDLYKLMSDILKNNRVYPLAIGGGTDHVHVFFENSPNKALADIMQALKTKSTQWINDNHLVQGDFQWQEEDAAFSYSHSERQELIAYINNQDKHHQTQSFKEEYLELLKNFNIEFEEGATIEFYD